MPVNEKFPSVRNSLSDGNITNIPSRFISEENSIVIHIFGNSLDGNIVKQNYCVHVRNLINQEVLCFLSVDFKQYCSVDSVVTNDPVEQLYDISVDYPSSVTPSSECHFINSSYTYLTHTTQIEIGLNVHQKYELGFRLMVPAWWYVV